MSDWRMSDTFAAAQDEARSDYFNSAPPRGWVPDMLEQDEQLEAPWRDARALRDAEQER